MFCNNKDDKLTIKNIEIFKNTLVWDLAIALESSKLELANDLILKNNENLVNFQDPYFGTTLLMRAISTENYEHVKFLLKKGANPNIKSKIGTTALFYSIIYSNFNYLTKDDPKYVRILLKYGADPNIPYCAPKTEGSISPIECGSTPLMLAVQRGDEKVKLLIEAGADINYKTKLGTTAAINALMTKDIEVAHYLIFIKKAKVTDPYYFYYTFDEDKINSEKPHLPISLLENWLVDLDSKEHKMKMDIVEEFKRQGQDYWSIEKHPKTIERIKKIYPNSWQEYLDRY